MYISIKSVLWALLTLFCFVNVQASDYKNIQWIDLLPEEDLKALTEAPIPELIGEGSPEDVIDSPIAMRIKNPVTEYERALVSVRIRNEFNKKKIKIPGFIVPVDTSSDGKATSFFLVPFFGACIHLPPPPPNQIIYVNYPKGISITSLDDPYWMEATIYTKQSSNDMATAAYSADAHKLYPFNDGDDY